MPSDVFQPFNEDIEKHGSYQYAKPDKPSAIYANRRFSVATIEGVNLDGKRVVDIGCGDGIYTTVLRDETRATSILGIDPASAAIDYARTKYEPGRTGLSFRAGFARDLVDEGQQFDVVVFRGVLHHVADPAREIADAFKLAKEVFILEPNGYNPVLKLIEKFSAYHIAHKEQSFGLHCLKSWIEAGGGEVVNSRYFCLVPFFSPLWMVKVGSALEPVIERIPLVRTVLCGQSAILARRRTGSL